MHFAAWFTTVLFISAAAFSVGHFERWQKGDFPKAKLFMAMSGGLVNSALFSLALFLWALPWGTDVAILLIGIATIAFDFGFFLAWKNTWGEKSILPMEILRRAAAVLVTTFAFSSSTALVIAWAAERGAIGWCAWGYCFWW